tara:strand:- start:1371 stop:1652 length:282 start_codon:yes stop_codon:yes gene_type:complete
MLKSVLYLQYNNFKKINKMNNYKITNKRSKRDYFLNEEETANFFVKNKAQNYSITNLTEQKRIKRNKILDNIQLVCFFALTILLTIYIIENFY